MLSVETVETFAGFRALEPAWNGLLAESGGDIPLMRHEWFACCWRSMGEDTRMLVLLVKENGRLVGIAPFMRTRERFRGLPAAAVILMGEAHYFRTGIIYSGDGARIVGCILDHLKKTGGHDVLILDLLEKDGATARALREAVARRGLRWREIPSDASPYIPVAGTWEDYFKTRSKNFKHKLNRVRNLFERRDHEIRHYTSDGIDEALDDMLAVSRKTWKFREHSAIVSDPENVRFYRTLAHVAAQRGWLSLRVLRVGGIPAAFAYNLVYGNRVYALQIEYDEDFAAMSPSEYLNTRAIRDCFSAGIAEYDWLGKDLSFKMKWTQHRRDHVKCIVFNDTAYGSLLYYWRTAVIEPVRRALSAGGSSSSCPAASPPAE